MITPVVETIVNKLVYGIILLKFYVRGTITQILGNLKRMQVASSPVSKITLVTT